MGTEKRERQKANRQQRLQQEARVERTGAIKRNVARWVIGGVAALGAVVVIAWVGGAFDSDEETAATIPALDTTPVDTFPTPVKPAVEIPDQIPTDLVVTTLEPGTGPEAVVGDTVTVHYVGVRSEDGVEFDNSYDRGTPFPVLLGSGGVIPGWEQGLIGAQAGAQLQLDIPSELAYGDADRGTIRPGDALSFVIDVMSVSAGS